MPSNDVLKPTAQLRLCPLSKPRVRSGLTQRQATTGATKMLKDGSEQSSRKRTGLGVGVAVFAAVWLIFDNVALGIVFGLLAALAYGSRKSQPETPGKTDE